MTERLHPATVVSGTVTTFMGFTCDQWSLIAIIIGIATTLASFSLDAFIKYRRYKRELGEK